MKKINMKKLFAVVLLLLVAGSAAKSAGFVGNEGR